MGQKLKVAAIQMDALPVGVPERLDRASNLIAEAVNGGARLVVLPEMFNTGYEFDERNYSLAEPIDGRTATWMKNQAAKHNGNFGPYVSAHGIKQNHASKSQ